MWPSITYERYAWERDPDDLTLIPKSRRRKILPTYEAAVPVNIATLPVELPALLMQRLAEVEVSLARFDTLRRHATTLFLPFCFVVSHRQVRR